MRAWTKGGMLAALALLALLAPAARAQSPQTIVLDGVNDFLVANRIDQDGGDTQFTNCDIGDFYITNDAVRLYIGFANDRGTWGTVQYGIAIDVNTADGGSTDPWGRQIEWSSAPYKPDFISYVNRDNNWQELRQWNGSSWTTLSSGPGSSGWVAQSTTFKEYSILLSTLGVSAGSTIRVEAWFTQDSPTKGPLDCVVNDGSQLSTPGFTLWDTTTPIPLTDLYAFTVLNAADNTAPVVERALHLASAVIDVTFSEPVGTATANVPGNYALGGGGAGGISISAAARDATQLNVVHLTLSGDIGPSASLYSVTVTNVQDLAGNPIVANGTTNKACFAVKNILFRGRMSYYLANNSNPPDQFAVEGNIQPLTFGPICDSGNMTDTGGGVYEFAADFCVIGDCGGATADSTLEWKFTHNCAIYEPLASNRTHVIDLAAGARDTIDVWWNDEDPTQFITHPIDVLFRADLNAFGYTPGDVVGLNGSVAPLNYDVPVTTVMFDDGSHGDATAADGIYALRVRFPVGARKNVTYKHLLNDAYECFAQGDRNVFLNDAAYDTVGGTLGELALPVSHFDACSVSWRAVEVVFTVDFNNTAWEGIKPGAKVSVNGTPSYTLPATFNWDVPSLNNLRDDGVAPDATAGDKIYSGSVVFADSSSLRTEYKYLYKDSYECLDQSNREFYLDPDSFDAAGTPQVLALDVFQVCNVTDVTDTPRPSSLSLDQNRPNPFNPSTEIRFVLSRGGPATLRIYNARGELVRSLLAAELPAGETTIAWDGRADDGSVTGSGLYVYRLEAGGEVVTKKMMLLK